ncbi:unnamed protein product [Cylindrotheca closterium]|uniref:Uncharacterized protein n=1 Tax=Cylindrotheca closterium TaxID=2856 RepID=A0AAD2CBJ2_9STRA|nr:unnamed protein product [Cylindrotheca closterium]
MKHNSLQKKRSSLAKRLKTASPSRRSKRIESKNNSVKNRADVLHGSILSHILTFSYIRDTPNMARTSSTWNAALEDAYEEICRETVHSRYPRLHELKLLEEDCLAGGSGTGAFTISTYKDILKRRVTMQYKPVGLNQKLQKDFHTIFAHKGIVAFSNCCSMCTDSYYEDDPTFQLRNEDGILCFKAFLNGRNFNPGMCNGVGVCYGALKYIHDHWEEECKLLDLWCHIVGLAKDDYSIGKPESINRAVIINLKAGVSVELEEPFEFFIAASPMGCTIQ